MWYWIVIGIALLLAIFVLAVARWCYGQAFYAPESKKKLDPHTFFGAPESEFCHAPMTALVDELLGTPCELVSITSRDGLKLTGRLYRFSDDARVEILFHGWRSSGIRDSSGGAKIARDLGYNLLIVDQRAHGDSDGNTITFGIKEKYDCVDWVRFVIGIFGEDVKILLGGVSMGAATVLMAAGLDELPHQVKAITADCGYSSPEAIIRKVCRDRGIPDAVGYAQVCRRVKHYVCTAPHLKMKVIPRAVPGGSHNAKDVPRTHPLARGDSAFCHVAVVDVVAVVPQHANIIAPLPGGVGFVGHHLRHRHHTAHGGTDEVIRAHNVQPTVPLPLSADGVGAHPVGRGDAHLSVKG